MSRVNRGDSILYVAVTGDETCLHEQYSGRFDYDGACVGYDCKACGAIGNRFGIVHHVICDLWPLNRSGDYRYRVVETKQWTKARRVE